jgi:hypothetical protein
MPFPVSVRKSRSFRLGLGFQIAFAVLVGLVNSTPAAGGPHKLPLLVWGTHSQVPVSLLSSPACCPKYNGA